MLQQTVTITNKLGLHARPSAKLTKTASKFQAEVWFTRNGRRVNGKSIMGVMMLAAGMGAEILVETDGIDEQEAMQALLELVQSKFDYSED